MKVNFPFVIALTLVSFSEAASKTPHPAVLKKIQNTRAIQTAVKTTSSDSNVKSCCALTNFPKDIAVAAERFENWAGETVVCQVLTAYPKTSDDVLAIVNYAHDNGIKARAKGCGHNWSPILVNNASTTSRDCACPRCDLILIDTQALNNLELVPSAAQSLPLLHAGAGARTENIWAFLEQQGFYIPGSPAPGSITLGGVGAIGGHGATSSSNSEWAAGTMSDRIVGLTAIVYDAGTGKYVTRTFNSTDEELRAYKVHLGRTIILDYYIPVVENRRLRVQSFTDIPATDLFADPKTAKPGTKTYTSFINQADSYGAEVILFFNTSNPWLKTWTVSPNKPLTSRAVSTPYNYPFSDIIPETVSKVAEKILGLGQWDAAPELGDVCYVATVTGLLATGSSDLWGWSKNVLLYIKDSTLRVTANSFCILTTRNNVQQVIHDLFTFFRALQDEYAERGEYPVNGPLEVRAAALDDSTSGPLISPLNPGNRAYDIGVYFNVLTFPTTPGFPEFSKRLEEFCYGTFTDGSPAFCRPEWTKGWAYTEDEAWSNADIKQNIKDSFPGWNQVVTILNNNDPDCVMCNDFVQDFLTPQ